MRTSDLFDPILHSLSERNHQETADRAGARLEAARRQPAATIAFHWGTVIAIVVGVVAVYLRDVFEDKAVRAVLLDLHRQLGILVLLCVPLRQLVRDARRGRSESSDIIKGTVTILVEQVRAHPAEFQFLTRERYGGIAAVRRAIDTELRLFTSELTVDLARLTAGADWSTDDLEMTADLMVAAMLATVMDLLEVDERRRATEDRRITDTAERQLRLIALGMAHWRSSP